MTSFRFLQFSDLHLGRAFSGSSLSLTDSQKETLRADRVRALETIVNRAVEAEVDVIFLPGDLFEEPRIDREEARTLRDAFEELHPVPVLVAPGNRDYSSPLSWYDPETFHRRTDEHWPENLMVFTSSQPETKPVPGTDGLSVTGIAHTSSECRTDRVLDEKIVMDRDRIHVLLLHASLDPSPDPERMNTHPITRQEVLNQELDYVALGHYHRPQSVEEQGRLRASYSGAPMGVTPDDTEAGTAMIGILGENGVDSKSVERDQVAPRSIYDSALSITSQLSPEALRKQVEEQIDDLGATEDDLVQFRLQGRRPSASLLHSEPIQSLRETYFHVQFDLSETSPGLAVDEKEKESAGRRTAEGRFIDEMRKRIEKAPTAEERRVREEALRIGVEALRDEEVNLT